MRAEIAYTGTLLHRRSVVDLSLSTISTSIVQPTCRSMSMQYMPTGCVQCVLAPFSHTVKQAQDVAAQAWDKEAAAMELEALTPEQQWEVGRQLVASLGDPASAERCRAVETAWHNTTSTGHMIPEGLSEGSSEDSLSFDASLIQSLKSKLSFFALHNASLSMLCCCAGLRRCPAIGTE
jgi:hypothetical protein